MADLPDRVVETLRDIIAPMVGSDGGVVYVVATDTGVHVHLAGACAGCPGMRTTTREVIEPALRAAGLRGNIEVTAGWTIPEGAQRVEHAGDGGDGAVDDSEMEPLSDELFGARSVRSLP